SSLVHNDCGLPVNKSWPGRPQRREESPPAPRLPGWRHHIEFASMELHTAVVTGANRADGIGLALVRELRARGVQRVVGSYRDAARSTALLDLAAQNAGV